MWKWVTGACLLAAPAWADCPISFGQCEGRATLMGSLLMCPVETDDARGVSAIFGTYDVVQPGRPAPWIAGKEWRSPLPGGVLPGESVHVPFVDLDQMPGADRLDFDRITVTGDFIVTLGDGTEVTCSIER